MVNVPVPVNNQRQLLLSLYLFAFKFRKTFKPGLPKSPNGSADNQIVLPMEQPETQQQQPEWVISFKDNLEQAQRDDEACYWTKFSIYRIPHYLKDGEDKAYIPQIVSLGPYHHGECRLRQMDSHKWRAVQHILKRTGHDISVYRDAAREMEETARSCYEGQIHLSSDKFIEMMVLDCSFVLELFRGVKEGFQQLGYTRNDPIFSMRGSMHSIQRDMIMLENQLPLFFLDRLLGIQFGDPDLKGLVSSYAIRFFDTLRPTDEPTDEPMIMESLGTSFDPLGDQRDLHCLDVFRRSLLSIRLHGPVLKNCMKRWSHRVVDKRRQQVIHCTTELRDSGIKFRKRKTDQFWDIKFEDGVLLLPRLLIHDGTRSLFLNLIAFEQSHFDCTNHITSYVIFMDNLINSPGDVRYLHYCGIIEHWLGSDAEVADMFNRLCKEVVFDINDSYLSELSVNMNRYCDHKCHTWRASLKHNYFHNPWAILSFTAAVMLLLLTFAQTFYGIYGFYRSSN